MVNLPPNVALSRHVETYGNGTFKFDGFSVDHYFPIYNDHVGGAPVNVPFKEFREGAARVGTNIIAWSKNLITRKRTLRHPA